ncbi:hypothetical protein P168DRAFT_294309 [Aspergillus campestris IBT 28561]|uniref:Peroxisomal membrane protein PEX14 n=1 Tax=Aspergillus campestris (strain IBT 28561) TaxID=1392248 RepID=A0A2I1DE88_ASPC2|nr:uncharacterized protein P168DRAFT_294309 [Aspergillus campestris IBT 28561]PKY08198.1 hypothetical protein P168DRAFT_294309 [Aspergillus campestris IBT 28561]
MAREEIISSADPSVASSPIEKRVAFLQSKNLTREEVDIALSRVGEDPAAAAAASSATGYQAPSQQAVYRPPPPSAQGYGYPPYGQWQPPPEPPKRDWRDWFIMATVMGGVGYGLYTVTKRYVAPLIAPPTPPQLEQDKENIDEQFSKAFTLIEQLSTDTAALKSAEETRTERLDSALREVESLVADLKTASRRRDDETRRINDEIRSLKDAIPKALEGAREGNDNRLKELGTELKSLKTLLGNRLGAPSAAAPPALAKSATPAPLPTASRPVETSSPATAAPTNGVPAPSVEQETPQAPAAAAAAASAPSPSTTPSSQFSRSASIPAWQMAAANRSKAASPAAASPKTNSRREDTMSTTDHRTRPHRPPSPSHSRSRSRSPDRDRSARHSDPKRHHHHHHHHRHHHRHHDPDRDEERRRRHPRHSHRSHRREDPQPQPEPQPVILPFQARELSRRHLHHYEPLFAMYLDIQKGIILEDLDDEEVKGRWKSFVGKWNRGELAEGWYDPAMLDRARKSAQENPPPLSSSRRPPPASRNSPDYNRGVSEGGEAPAPEGNRIGEDEGGDDDDDDEDYGPSLPRFDPRARGGPSSGPTIPTMQDLDLRKESAREDALEARHDWRKEQRYEKQSHRAEMRHIQDEVAPRAEPGTHERRMEKRAENAAANRSFAEGRRGGSPTEGMPDDELMGSGENELTAIRKDREREQRKKNDREIRREEIMRARAAEREERVQQYRQKEDETIGWLKTLAKQRFG